MSKRFKFSSHRVIAMSLILLLPLILIARNMVVGAAQDQDRVVKKVSWPGEPVKVSLVKTKKGVIELGKKFSDNDNWFNGVTLSIENTSGKTITYIAVALVFGRHDNQTKKPPFAYSIEYGQRPLRLVGQDLEISASNRFKPVLPGDTVDINVSDNHYNSIKFNLEKGEYPASVKEIEVLIEEIISADGMLWSAGKWFRRDPNDPSKFIQEAPQQPQSRLPKRVTDPLGVVPRNLKWDKTLQSLKIGWAEPKPAQSNCVVATPRFHINCFIEGLSCYYEKQYADQYSSGETDELRPVVRGCVIRGGPYDGWGVESRELAKSLFPAHRRHALPTSVMMLDVWIETSAPIC